MFKPASLQVLLHAEGTLANFQAQGVNQWPYDNESYWTTTPRTPWTVNSSTVEQLSGTQWRTVEQLQATINSKSYQLEVTTDYTSPNYYADVTYKLIGPSDATGIAHLYLASDFLLNGNDYGPGVTLLVNGKRLVAQAVYSGTNVAMVGGLIEPTSGEGFTSYYEENFLCVFGSNIAQFCPGGAVGPTVGSSYPNTVNTKSVDAGVGAHWNLGSVANKTVTRSVKLYFAQQFPEGAGPPPPTSVTATAGIEQISVAFATVTGATSYKATCISSTGGVEGSATGTGTPIIVTSLTAGDTYTCKVTATQLGLESQPSDASNTAVPQAAIVNGACGSANTQTFTSTPTANLCTAGTAGSVTPGNTSYTWSCAGSNGGTTASCSATRNYVIATNVSGSGTINPTSQNADYNATKTFTVTPAADYEIASVTGCGGTLSGSSYTTGAITSACTINVTYTKIVNGACGTANGQTFTSPPTDSLCTAGTAGSVTAGNESYTWSCVGSEAGDHAACSATRNYVISTSVTGTGQISPTSLNAAYNEAKSFDLTPAEGYVVTSASGCGGSLTGSTYTTGAISSACTVTVTFTQFINGECGAANGTKITSPPDQNLCNAGQPSTVTNPKANLWTWSCDGSGGGITQLCSAGSSGGIGDAPKIELTKPSGCTINSVQWLPAPQGGPTNQVMPYGLVDFELGACRGNPATVEVRLTFLGSVEGHTLWKYGRYPNANSATEQWYAMPGAVVSGNTITYSITDNGIGDSDPDTGDIADPAGPGYPLADIPTLSEWAQLMTILLLMVMAGWYLPRHRRH